MKEHREVRIVERGSPDALLISKATSSPTAAELLDSLAAGQKTATELEEETHYPLPTIQYHITNLLNAGLIEVTGTRYSEKGRKMKVYAASDTLLVISPKLTTAEQIKPVLRRYGIPVAGVAVVSAAGLAVCGRLLSDIQQEMPVPQPKVMMFAGTKSAETVPNAASYAAAGTDAAPSAAPLPDAVPNAADAAGTLKSAVNSLPEVTDAAVQPAAGAVSDTAFVLSQIQTGLIIFLIAAAAVLIGLIIFEIVRIKRSGSRRRR